MNPKESVQTQRRVTEEEALRNARELIEEEEREKFQEEKKKAKRKVQLCFSIYFSSYCPIF